MPIATRIVALVLFATTGVSTASAQERVALSGQVVCSSCWHEADRAKVAYGTDADRVCAVKCGKGGVPGALAVVENGDTVLYLLERGEVRIDDGETSWMHLAGRRVEIRGAVRLEGDRRFLRVDAVRVLANEER